MIQYGIYTQRFLVDGEFEENRALNGYYDLSFFMDYPRYALPGVIKITDGSVLVPDDKLKSEYRLMEIEYECSEEELQYYSTVIPKEFNVQLLTKEEAIQWVRSYTTMEEIRSNVFLISPEENVMNWFIPEKLLDLN